VLPAVAVLSVLAGVGAANLAQLMSPERRTPGSAAPRLAGVVAAVALIALAGQSFAHARVQRLRGEARAVGIRMQLHRDLAETVRAAGGAGAVRALGWSTTNRALQTRLAWELGVPMELTESLTDYRVIFRSWREPLVGRVYMTGRARHRQTLARVGSFRVYRRDGITFPIARRDWKRSWVRLQDFCREFTPA
jgi:tryptophan 2,3-dioxygenase